MTNRRRLLQFSCAQSLAIGIGFPIANALAANGEYAPDAACRELALEAGAVSDRLEEFSVEAGVSIVVDHRLIEGLVSPAIHNAPDCISALATVLSNANLNIHKVNGSTLVISEPAPDIATRPVAPEPKKPFTPPPVRDEIIVTGSRLLLADFKSTSPSISIEANEIHTRGVTRIEDLINILPQAFAAQTSQLANGATGTSSLDLRGLGEVRTLVLLDGKRLPYGSPNTSPSNLDLIPVQLVERVDVVTGGASAIYGSDALSGVANFILRRDFEGVELDGQVSFFQDGNNGEFANAVLQSFNQPQPSGGLDGRSVNVSATFGANTADGRGNVTAFIQYQDQNEIRQDARDYSACAYSIATVENAVGGVACGGSSTFRRLGLNSINPNFDPMSPADPIANPNFNPLFPAGLFLNEDGALVPFTGAPEQLFNFAPDNFIQRNNERFNISAFARYEVTDNVEAYMDLSFTENTTDSQLAFSGTFFRNFQINCDNPFLEAAVPGAPGQDTVATGLLGCSQADIDNGVDVSFGGLLGPGYRNVNGNPRSSFIGLSTFRMVGGFRGTLGDNWNWDTFGQFSRTRLNTTSTGDLSFAAVQDAFFVVDDGIGNPVCRSGASGCLPFNIFQRPGGVDQVTPEVAQSIQGNGFNTGTVDQIVLGGTIGGDLGAQGVQFPWAENGVQALLGAEYRRDHLDRNPDEISQIPGGRGLTGVNAGSLMLMGDVSVWELFMETQIPLIEGKPFFEEFGVNGAYRYSNYTTDGNGVQNDFDTHTFAAGLTWAPIQDVRFRGQFQRAVRAPNVIELFTGQNTGLFGAFDPCSNLPSSNNSPIATAAQCAFTGVTAGQYGAIPFNPASQLNVVTGGNPFLNPEKSNTYTLGVVFTPSFAPSLNLAVDYFDISVNDAISTIPPQTTLNECIATGEEAFCDLIVRDTFGTLFVNTFINTNDFTGVFAVNTNIAKLSTRGVDVASSYGHDFGGWGNVNLDFIATYLLENSFNAIPGVTSETECLGFFSGNCVGPIPEYRHRLLATWQTPWDMDVSATWRHFGGVDNFTVFGPDGSAANNVLDDSLDAANYLDLAVQWYVRGNLTVRVGVQNIFGRDPELTTQAGTAPGNGNTYPGFYDSGGRRIFIGINFRG
ncbi:MAG: TonB-dependent receptor [Pseudomonadota bacterium]